MTTIDGDKGFQCADCKTIHLYPAYVFAHWDDKLVHTCECGAIHSIQSGEAELMVEETESHLDAMAKARRRGDETLDKQA